MGRSQAQCPWLPFPGLAFDDLILLSPFRPVLMSSTHHKSHRFSCWLLNIYCHILHGPSCFLAEQDYITLRFTVRTSCNDSQSGDRERCGPLCVTYGMEGKFSGRCGDLFGWRWFARSQADAAASESGDHKVCTESFFLRFTRWLHIHTYFLEVRKCTEIQDLGQERSQTEEQVGLFSLPIDSLWLRLQRLEYDMQT